MLPELMVETNDEFLADLLDRDQGVEEHALDVTQSLVAQLGREQARDQQAQVGDEAQRDVAEVLVEVAGVIIGQPVGLCVKSCVIASSPASRNSTCRASGTSRLE